MADVKDKKLKLLINDMGKMPMDEFTPEKMIDNECLDRILDDGIEKLKISLLLPKILANPLVIQLSLKDTPYVETYRVIQRFIKHRMQEIRKLKQQKLEKKRKKPTAVSSDSLSNKEPRITVEIIKLIDYFHQNKKMMEFLPNWLDEISDYHETLLKGMCILHDVTKEHLKLTAKRQLFNEKKLHALYQEKEGLKKEVMETEKQLISLKSRSRWKAGARSVLINNYIHALNSNNDATERAVIEEFQNLNRFIRTIKNQSVVKRRELEEELETVTMEYEKQKLADAKAMKLAIDEKNKYEIQLQAILTKYDTTIYEKFHDHLYLQDEYEEKKKVFDEFMVYYRAEEEIYNTVVVERRKEEEAIQQAKIQVFKYYRAAMRIQRWLRMLWNAAKQQEKAHQSTAKKAKKGKKGKK